ncbi:MAG: TIGR00730 family Rossman fold protein [Candidatus Paceibacterota bacterium]
MSKKKNYLTPRQIKESCEILNPDDPQSQRVCKINEEFKQGFEILESNEDFRNSVSIFGSARFDKEHKYYKKAYSLARKIGEELKLSVITGGGPGIMEAANHGAFDAGVPSLGMTIKLPAVEEETNKYVTQEIPFDFFFSRKVLLMYSAKTYIFFPGGYGTLDEFFNLITQMKTGKIPMVPIVLFGTHFWSDFDSFIKETLLDEYKTISEGDIIYKITDDEDEVLEIVKNAPSRVHE